MSTKKPTRDKLAELAGTIRAKVSVPRQEEVFRAAVAAAQLASSADGKVDDKEKKAMVEALELLSAGLVIEWEVDLLLEEAAGAGGGEDAKTRAVGAKLKELGQPEAGLLVAAFVAQSTAGIDQKEAKVLRAIGKSAGIADKRVREILKDVGAETPE
jgi:tellurite resistance protein